MKTSEYMALRADELPKGYVFTYADLITQEKDVAKCFAELVKRIA